MNKQDTVLMLTEESYLIDKALKYIMLNNKSNFLPYHNLSHCMNVSGWAYDITRHQYPQEYKLQWLMALVFFTISTTAVALKKTIQQI